MTTPLILLTILGATLWCGFLVALGYFVGQPAIDLIKPYMHELAIAAHRVGKCQHHEQRE